MHVSMEVKNDDVRKGKKSNMTIIDISVTQDRFSLESAAFPLINYFCKNWS